MTRLLLAALERRIAEAPIKAEHADRSTPRFELLAGLVEELMLWADELRYEVQSELGLFGAGGIVPAGCMLGQVCEAWDEHLGFFYRFQRFMGPCPAPGPKVADLPDFPEPDTSPGAPHSEGSEGSVIASEGQQDAP